MKKWYLFGLLFLAANGLVAQGTGNLYVTVQGKHYGYPLEGAKVMIFMLKGQDTVKHEGVTDDKGLLKFMNIDAGKYQYYVEFQQLYRVAWEFQVKKNKINEETIILDDTQPFRKRILDELIVNKSIIDSVASLYNTGDTLTFRSARYKKGNSELRETIRTNRIYPHEAYSRKIEGEVKIRVLIDERGSLKGLYLAESPNASLDFNALWAASQLKEWKPATYNGKAVSSVYDIPVDFFLK